MSVSISVDTGGTYTDGYFISNGNICQVKADTTPGDLTEGFFTCLKKGADALGYKDLSAMLRDTDTCRFSTTLATNTIITKSGPRLGLIVTAGWEDTLYGPEPDKLVIGSLLERTNVAGVTERVDENGKCEIGVDPENLLQQVKGLLMNGCRMILVSLANSSKNSANEQAIKEIINRAYPPHYLGAVPILLSSEITSSTDNAIKTYTTIVNGYIHQTSAKYLFKADEMIRKLGFRNPLTVVHNDGGTARVAKTRAIDTYNSGPVAAVIGASVWAQKYGHQSVLTVDVGGTSTDIGLVYGEALPYTLHYDIEGIPVDRPCISINAVGGGGGSIVKCSPELSVGPQSAGAVPGPACYDLGGLQATITDAWVILGMVNPEFFLGGERKLRQDLAVEAFRPLADKLNTSIEKVAYSAVHKLETEDANRILETIGNERAIPRAMYVYGGGGGGACCGIAESLGIDEIYSFSTSAVFSPFGASRMDITHVYDETIEMQVGDQNLAGKLKSVLEKLRERTVRDMRGEGFSNPELESVIEITVKNGQERSNISLEGQVVEEEFITQSEQIISAIAQHGDIKQESVVERLRLRSKIITPKQELMVQELGSSDSNHALKNKRPVFWGDQFQETPVYDYTRLQPGNIVHGPAIIETPLTTYVIRDGWEYQVDQFMNGAWRRIGGK